MYRNNWILQHGGDIMTGCEVFKKFTDVDFALRAKTLAEQKQLDVFDTEKEAIEFLTLYGCLLKSKNQPYNEKQYLLNYVEFHAQLKEKGFLWLEGKTYRVTKNTCSAE